MSLCCAMGCSLTAQMWSDQLNIAGHTFIFGLSLKGPPWDVHQQITKYLLPIPVARLAGSLLLYYLPQTSHDCDLPIVALGIQILRRLMQVTFMWHWISRGGWKSMEHFQFRCEWHLKSSSIARLTQQTSNHMPRLDCPSVSAETLHFGNPLSPQCFRAAREMMTGLDGMS